MRLCGKKDNDTRDRLLAILKEPDRFRFDKRANRPFEVFDASDNATIKAALSEREAGELCADLNASHRLKRLCEEYARFVIVDLCSSMNAPHEREVASRIASAILALGEDNEHS